MAVTESKVTLQFANEQANKRGKTDLRMRTCGVTELPILTSLFDILYSKSYDLCKMRERYNVMLNRKNIKIK